MIELGFWTLAAARPGEGAIVAPGGKQTAFGELLAGANQVVHGLRSLGLRDGDCVAMALPNCPHVLELFMAVTQAGMYLVPVNWHLTAAEMAYILRDSGAKVFVAAEPLAEVCAEAARTAEISLDRCFCIGRVAGFRDYAELLHGQPENV